MEPKETFSKLRSQYTFSPGKNLDTLVSTEVAADVLVSEDIARKALVNSDVIDHWRELDTHFPSDSPQASVIGRSIDEALLVSAAARQIVGDIDNSREIGQLEERLFDYYSPDLFYAAAAQKMATIEALTLPADLEPSRALILTDLAKYADRASGASMEKPTGDTLNGVGAWLHGQFDDLFQELESDGIERYDAKQIAAIFQSAIDSTPSLRTQGWQAKQVVREKTAISTYSSKRELAIPTQRTATERVLKNLIVHEVFGHALRSSVAEELGIPVADQGTATYARFEESFLIALEQCLSGTYNPERGVDHYLAVGLSVTGGESKDEIARLFESMAMLGGAQKGIDEELRTKATRSANGQLRRTFVGMTDVDDGIAHRKDIDYLHGLNDSWRLLNYAVEHKIIDETMRWLLSAKFNPFTKQDRDLVSSYVPMPPALESFFTAA